jgi:hypothetical protein
MLASPSPHSRSRQDHIARSAAVMPSLITGEDNLTLLATGWQRRKGSADIRHGRLGGE